MTGWRHLLDSFENAVETIVHAVGVTSVMATDRAVRAAEFGLVGLSGAIVNAVVFLWLVTGEAYLIPGMIAFWLAVAWTFGLNWIVTFDETRGQLYSRFARYMGVCSIGYLVYTTVLSAAVELVHLAYPLAVGAAIAIAGAWNFVGAELFAMDIRRSGTAGLEHNR